MEKIHSFLDLKAWQSSHVVALRVYEITKLFPREELFGLSSQMRRAAVSVASNIAEGFGRRTMADKANFYTMAKSSSIELQSQLVLARDLGYIEPESCLEISKLIENSQSLLSGLIRSTLKK